VDGRGRPIGSAAGKPVFDCFTAVCETVVGTRAVINTNSLDDRAAFTRQAAPVDHDGRPPPAAPVATAAADD
jgi:hypothetical protein